MAEKSPLLPPKLRVFVVDDDPLTMASLQLVLSSCVTVTGFTDPNEALEAAKALPPEIAVLDLNFPQANGMELLKQWKQEFPQTELISCSGDITVQKAVECLRQGASDYLVKPFHSEALLHVIQRTILRRDLPKTPSAIDYRNYGFIGRSHAIQDVLRKVERLKHQTHLNVLILGESGTGKELIAKLLNAQESVDPKKTKGIHEARQSRPIVMTNMSAIPTNLLEAELFGVERGAFTDAKTSRPGKFELAHQGDIFLDEIGDLPSDTQVKILRVLQDKKIQRLGSTQIKEVTFRTIAATNRPLAELVAKGVFREDLMYRLTDMVIWLPALRDRIEDIAELTQHFIEKYQGNRNVIVSKSVIEQLQNYHWPGNVRQLESTIKRALIFAESDNLKTIEILDPLSLTLTKPESNVAQRQESLEEKTNQFEKSRIEDALRQHGGNRTLARKSLNLSKATFYRRVTELDVALPPMGCEPHRS